MNKRTALKALTGTILGRNDRNTRAFPKLPQNPVMPKSMASNTTMRSQAKASHCWSSMAGLAPSTCSRMAPPGTCRTPPGHRRRSSWPWPHAAWATGRSAMSIRALIWLPWSKRLAMQAGRCAWAIPWAAALHSSLPCKIRPWCAASSLSAAPIAQDGFFPEMLPQQAQVGAAMAADDEGYADVQILRRRWPPIRTSFRNCSIRWAPTCASPMTGRPMSPSSPCRSCWSMATAT